MKFTFLLILSIVILSCKSDNKKTTLTKTTNRIGIRKFKVADKNIKDSIVEYIKIDGKEYANQIWLINANNEKIGGNYFESVIEDTTKLGEITQIRFFLDEPSISYESDMFVLLPIDDNKLKNDYSNLFEIELDTFPSLKTDGIPHPELSQLDLPLNLIAVFGLKYDNPGQKRIRGAIIERGSLNDKRYERRLFFDKSFYIKE